MTRHRLAAIALSTALFAAACGGSDDASDATPASDTGATPESSRAESAITTTGRSTTVRETTPPSTDPPATSAQTSEPATTVPVEPEPGVPTVVEVDPGGQLSPAALELLALFDGERFPSDTYDDGTTNGPLFVELARVSALPAVTAAALNGARATSCFFDEDECTLVTQDTTDMLLGHLTLDTDPTVLLSALDFADPVMTNSPVHDEILAEQVRGTVIALGTASDDPRLTRAVVGAIGTSGFFPGTAAFRGSAELEELFRTSIASPDAALAYTALTSLNMGRPDDAAGSDNFYGAVTAELDDSSAIVRAAALETLRSFAEFLDEDDPRWVELFAIADAARADADPMIRRNALKIWGSLGDPVVIPTLIADHLDDEVSAEIDYVFERYDGNEVDSGVIHGSVSLAALEVITELTGGTDFEFDVFDYEFERGFDAPPIGEQVAEQAVPDAREWFAANEAAIAAAANG
ncbi:MAG: hypothetical protein AAFY28_03100 [Actinomycetota bacterium]